MKRQQAVEAVRGQSVQVLHQKRMLLLLLLRTASAASLTPLPGSGEEVGSGDPSGLLSLPTVGSGEVGSGDDSPSSPGSGEVGSGDTPPPPSPASATPPPLSPTPPPHQTLAQIYVSERSADDTGGSALTDDHVLFAVVCASVSALTVFVIMMGVRSVLGGRKAGSAAGGGDTEGGGSERSEAARARAQRWGSPHNSIGGAAETGDVGLEVDDFGACEPHVPSSRAGGELGGDVALAEPSAPRPSLGRASAGLSEDVRASAALSRQLNKLAMISATGRAALARAQGARLKRADSRAALRRDVEAGLQDQRRDVESLQGITLPSLSGVSTHPVPGGGALPGGSTPTEEDPHTAPAPSARALGRSTTPEEDPSHMTSRSTMRARTTPPCTTPPHRLPLLPASPPAASPPEYSLR